MDKTERIHAICAYLRDDGVCNNCPASEPPFPGYEEYGNVQRACYGIAEQVFNIAIYGTWKVRETTGDLEK